MIDEHAPELKHALALQHACPLCNAQPPERCWLDPGHTERLNIDEPHAERLALVAARA